VRAAFVGEQSRQDFFSNRVFCGIESATGTALRDSSQTVAESVLIPWWTGFAGDACHGQSLAAWQPVLSAAQSDSYARL